METEHNPYQTPATKNPSKQDRKHNQAGRGTRLIAAFIDGILLGVIILPIQWWAGAFDGYPDVQGGGLGEVLMWSVFGFLAFLVVNGYLLATRAQSVGKVAMGIKIINMNGENAPFGNIVLRRMLPIAVVGSIPVIGGFFSLIDVLFIFTKDHQCIHDRIAGTRVVTV